MLTLVPVLRRTRSPQWQFLFLTGLLALSPLTLPARSQSTSNTVAPAQKAAPAARPARNGPPTTYRPAIPRRERAYYGLAWGVDEMSVKSVEAGELIRFSWRVLDADKAKDLNDKKLQPFLIDPQAGVKLVVPSMEFVGQMRQSSTPEAGRQYWMTFSNPGRKVKPGDRVYVVVGNFHADMLAVQ